MSTNNTTEERPLPYGRMVVVKFKEGMKVRLKRDELTSTVAEEVEGVQEVLGKFPGVTVNRLFSRSVRGLDADRKAATAADVPASDLNLFYRLDLTEDQDPDALVEELKALPNVEMAYIEPEYSEAAQVPSEITAGMTTPTLCPPGPISCPPGPQVPHCIPGPILPPPLPCALATPDFSVDQDYLGPAPTGIDALYAWTRSGGKGQNVKFADIEFGWLLSHEDLTSAASATVFGTNTGSDHGTNVLGEVIGVHDSKGVKGISPDASVGVLCSIQTKTVADCINHAASVLDPGDVILIELQTGFRPVEVVEANYVAIQTAVAAGVVVVEAAGNGAYNLDNYDRSGEGEFILRRSVRDSGAIMVGAGCPPSGSLGPDRSRWQYSNYGSRLDVQGQGREVCTTGDGALFDCGPDRRYNDDFRNTSAASPQVVSAVLALEGISKARDGTVITPAQVRQVLVDTGTPQQDGNYGPATQQIGPRPNLRAAINRLWPGPVCPSAPIELLCPPAPIEILCPPAPFQVQCPPAPFQVQCPPAPFQVQCPPAPFQVQCPPAPFQVQCPPGPGRIPFPPRPFRRPVFTPQYGEYPAAGVSRRRWRRMQAQQGPYYGYRQAADYAAYGYPYYGAYAHPGYTGVSSYGYQPSYSSYGYQQIPQAASYATYGYPYSGAYGYPGYSATYAYGYDQNPYGPQQPPAASASPVPGGEFEPQTGKE